MEQINAFSQYDVQTSQLTGKKIELEEVLNQNITVSDYRINPSKYANNGRGNGMCLSLQIKHEGVDRVVFTGSVILQEQITKAKEQGIKFPFTTTIVQLKPKGYKFT